MLEASIVVIGDEILGGFVQDANSGWLAQRLQTVGVPLSRIHVVPDEHAAITDALDQELARSRPRVIFTTGGIGSTPDDVTFEAVAATVGRDLEEHPTIAERIHQALAWTTAHGVEVTDDFAWHMLRMARIPADARLVQREDGWVPGIQVDVDGGSDEAGVSIVILPGIPSELRRIVTEVIEPELLAGRNELPAVVEVTHRFPESCLNLCFAAVLEAEPEVKLGSYPGSPMVVRLVGPPAAVERARAIVQGHVDTLEADPGGARLADAWERRFGAFERDES